MTDADADQGLSRLTSATTASSRRSRRTPIRARCSCSRTSRRRHSNAPARRGEAHYYSRSRDELWHKGGSSGHTQEVREVRVDCDADTLLYLVDQNVGACHTGHRSCFYRTVDGEHVGERVFDPDEVY